MAIMAIVLDQQWEFSHQTLFVYWYQILMFTCLLFPGEFLDVWKLGKYICSTFIGHVISQVINFHLNIIIFIDGLVLNN